MKKNMIALLLSIVMVVGSFSGTPVLAAETTAEATVAVEEETVEEAVTDESTEDASEEKSAEEVEAEPEQDLTESVEEAEKAETTKNEEPVVTEEEVKESEAKEAALAEGDDVVASGKCGDSITWQLDTSGRLVIDGEGDMYKYVSPSEQGEKVPWASYVDTTKMITSVEISEGITSISPYAFYTCYGDYDNVHEVTIPSTVTTIDACAFYGWGGVEELWMPKNLKKIGSYAFAWSSISSIHMEDEIQKIESYAFYHGNLSRIYGYEDSYAEIYAKNNSKEFISIGVDDKPSIISEGKCGDSITWQLDTSGRLVIDGEGDMYKYVSPSEQGEKVPWASYVDTTKMITSVEISEGITSISPYAFYTCYGDYDNVHEVTIPSTVTTIGEYAFYAWGDSRTVYFKGGVPKGELIGLTATGYYPASDPSWTDSARQNLQGTITWVPWDPTSSGGIEELNIVSTTPVNGDTTVDHALDYYSIQFDEFITYAKEGYAYLYDVSDESNPVAKALIGYGEDNDNTQSQISGRNTLEIHFPFSPELGHEYYIKIDSDCIKKDLSDSAQEEASSKETYFNGITDSYSWRFKICPIDYMHFGNPTDIIHESVYHVLFTPIKASWIKMFDDGSKGTCYGWSYAVGAKANEYDGINGFGRKLMNLEKNSVYKATDFTLLEYIHYAHLSQYTYEKSKEKNKKNKYDDLLKAIKASINGTGPKIIVCVFGNGGHAVYPLSIIDENDSEIQVRVINPNEDFSTGSHFSTLTLKKQNGIINGFQMEEYNKDISFCTIDSSIDEAFSMASSYMSESNMVHSSVPIDNSDYYELESCGNDNNAQGVRLYWYDGSQIGIGLSSDNQVGITDGYKDVSVKSASDADITLDLDKMTATIDSSSDVPSKYEISYTEVTSGDDTKTTTVSSSATGMIASKKTSEGIVIQSPESEDITVNTDNQSIRADIKGDTVLIKTTDENGIEVFKDPDGNGNYDEQVEVEILNVDGIQLVESMVLDVEDKTYTGFPITQEITLKDGDTVLARDTDYTVSYENNKNVGTATIMITGIGNYTGSVTKTFTINKAVNKITAKNFIKTYSTKAQSFWTGVKVADGVRTFKSNSKSVTVSKSGKVTIKAKFIGKATITITAPETKNYKKTTKKITITVNPTKTALSSVTSPSAGKMTVKWKKNAVGTGYLFQYSTSSKFKSPKTVKITKNTTLSKTIGGLTKGKKYYVRIRTYKTVGKTKFYSGWSTAKAVTIKK